MHVCSEWVSSTDAWQSLLRSAGEKNYEKQRKNPAQISGAFKWANVVDWRCVQGFAGPEYATAPFA
jgi:hypothetical protein